MPYIKKKFLKDKGFTLIELMVVLVILGIILAIGGPQYAKIKNQAEYDADRAIIEGLARSAEMYAARINSYDSVRISALITSGDIQNVKLNSRNNDLEHVLAEPSLNSLEFEFDPNLGFVTNLEDVILALTGGEEY